jgi:hypothetical protein
MPFETLTPHQPDLPHAAPEALRASAFMGLWQVRRRLVDHLGQTHLAFTGQARIGADSFTETGELHSNRGMMESKRFYLLAMDDTGADVRFAGGSDFIRLDLAPDQRVVHHCGDDLYEGRFMFRSLDCFIEFWRVAGPRKRYASLTRYERIPATP